MKTKRVRLCFGKYGEKEEKNCNGDCLSCMEQEEAIAVLFCKKKTAFPCDILCDEGKLCRECYWLWWDKNNNKRCSLSEEIRGFMEENRIIFNKKMDTNQDGKNRRRTNKNR